MTNWKYTATLIATCLFGFVVFSPETFAKMPWLIQLSKFALAGGLAGIGIAAHNQAIANASAIQQVDRKVAETHMALNGRLDQLVPPTKVQAAPKQPTRTKEHTS